jgi:small-conductance mechanosensitive channel
MPASDFQRKALSFIIFTGVAVLLLLAIPLLIEPAINNYLMGQGWQLTPQGKVLPLQEGRAVDMMTATSNSLIEHGLRLAKVLIWMALVISLVRFVAFLILSTFRGAKTEAFSLVKTVLSIIVYIVAFFIIFQTQYPGIELAPLFTGSAILGIVVGLALQDTLGNLFAGIALQADQPFQVGDVIAFMNGQRGVIESVSWRGVRIRTFENRILVVSNSSLGKETIEVSPRDNLNARLVFFNTLYVNSPSKTIRYGKSKMFRRRSGQWCESETSVITVSTSK